MVVLRRQDIIPTAANLRPSIESEFILHGKGEQLLRSLKEPFLDLIGEPMTGDLEKPSLDAGVANGFHNLGDRCRFWIIKERRDVNTWNEAVVHTRGGHSGGLQPGSSWSNKTGSKTVGLF